ncbi:hypothetical protein HRbin27_00896 [bacterium HR27]|nr:hypothetical protein HRbin27_00896 [bacterium HR27]
MVAPFDRHDAEQYRDAALVFVGVPVGYGRSVLDATETRNRAGGKQEGLCQRCLASTAMGKEADIADPFRGVLLHGTLLTSQTRRRVRRGNRPLESGLARVRRILHLSSRELQLIV